MSAEQSPIEREVGRAIETVLQNYVGVKLDALNIEQIKDEIDEEAKLTLLGLRQAAEMLGLSPQRLRQLEVADKMPEPAATVETGQRITRIWLQADVLDFADQRQAIRDTYNVQRFSRPSVVEQARTATKAKKNINKRHK